MMHWWLQRELCLHPIFLYTLENIGWTDNFRQNALIVKTYDFRQIAALLVCFTLDALLFCNIYNLF